MNDKLENIKCLLSSLCKSPLAGVFCAVLVQYIDICWVNSITIKHYNNTKENIDIYFLRCDPCDSLIRGWKTDNKRFPVHRFTKMGLLSFEQQLRKGWTKAW